MASGSDSNPASGPAESPSDEYGCMTAKECQGYILESFKNPLVKVMVENLQKNGCIIGRKFIRAVNCKEKKVAGGYSRKGGIVVCSNNLRYPVEVEQVVIHELIHAYDDCRAANMDWSNCAHQACSEIRANRLSCDCHLKFELLRGFLNIKGHEKECIRRRAMRSVMANCSEYASKIAMEAVWDTCYNDVQPFDKPPSTVN